MGIKIPSLSSDCRCLNGVGCSGWFRKTGILLPTGYGNKERTKAANSIKVLEGGVKNSEP